MIDPDFLNPMAVFQRLFVTSVLLVLSIADRAAAEAHIDQGCLGNNSATCFVLIEGQIEKGLTERFQRYLDDEGVEGSRLILNSPGGNLGEALKLGRLIRELEWRTMIGGSGDVPRNSTGGFDILMWETYPANGICESACAYVFMGGVNRSSLVY